MREALLALRHAANLTQKDAASALGICQSTISMWETGDSKPKTELLPRIAELYGCSLLDLFQTT